MKTLLSLALALFSLGAFAQTSLEFNKVLLLDSTEAYCSTCWTVPAGKVWKITGYGGSNNNTTLMYLNGGAAGRFTGTPFTNTSSTYLNSTYRSPDFPIWIGEGTQFGYDGFSTGKNHAFYGIEFNVVP